MMLLTVRWDMAIDGHVTAAGLQGRSPRQELVEVERRPVRAIAGRGVQVQHALAGPSCSTATTGRGVRRTETLGGGGGGGVPKE